MYIIGAGLAGLICGVVNKNAKIIEANKAPTVNHRAVLRLRTPELGKITGIPMKKVTVYKSIWYHGKEVPRSPRISHLYSLKTNSKLVPRSINNLDPVERFIPPENLMETMRGLVRPISYGKGIKEITKDKIYLDDTTVIHRSCQPVVSTMPMFNLSSRVAGLKAEGNFAHKAIFVTQVEIDECDSYCTVYYPDPAVGVYRASLNGNILIVESTAFVDDEEMSMVLHSLAIPGELVGKTIVDNHVQTFGKITDIDPYKRNEFMLQCSLNYGIYALGRFATWRPGILADDVLDDVYAINDLIAKGSYGAFKYRIKD